MTLFERIKNASPIVTRATLNKEIDRRIADAAYFKQVKAISDKRIIDLKYQLAEVILSKNKSQ